MSKKREKVSVVECSSYKPKEVRKAMLESLKNIGFLIPQNKTILLKPNLLTAASPTKAITTHPIFVEEICKLLKAKGNKLIIAESSMHDTDLAIKATGIANLKKYGQILNLETTSRKAFKLHHKNLKIVRLPKILFDVDLIVNLPKLKTHSLMKMTCAVKNLYGCIPGNTKELFHKLMPSEKKFAKFLLELEKIIAPQLNLVDAIIGLEGEGPGASGIPKKTGLVLASKSAVALDVIAAEIIGYKKDEVLTNKFGVSERNIEAELIGVNKKVFYKKPMNMNFLVGIYNFIPRPKIAFDKDKCIKCGLCGKKCPTKAITYHPYPECNHKFCIKCLCCMEICPQKAVYLEKDLLRKIWDFMIYKTRKL